VLSFFNQGTRQGWGKYGEILARRWLLGLSIGGLVTFIGSLGLMAMTR
jgi:hypothetical protein